MQKVIFVLTVTALFCTLSLAQNQLILADQQVDFSMVEETQDLQYAFDGQYHVEEFDLEKTMAEKANPVGKGAVIGFGVGAALGILGGAAVASAQDVGSTMVYGIFGQEPPKQNHAGAIVGGAIGGGLIGLGTGALIGSIVKKNKKPTKYPEAIEYKTPEPPARNIPIDLEVQIISLSHNF